MLKQTLKFALRNFKKSKLIHGLNILGLTLGLSVFFLSSLYIYQENSYERDFSDKERIYQISSVIPGIGDFGLTTENLASIADKVPEMEDLTVFSMPFNLSWTLNNNENFELKTISADDSFLKVFDFEVLQGNREMPISAPSDAAIFESAALKVFGTTDVIGKRLESKSETLHIVALLADPQYKTQLKSDLIQFKNPIAEYKESNWNSNVQYVYTKAIKSVSKAQLNRALERISYEYIRPVVMGTSGEVLNDTLWETSPQYKGLKAETLNELRTTSESLMSIMPKANTKQSKAMILVGLASLLISVINFINLFTAKASARHKEVGVKRILGSKKSFLISQFLLESFMLTMLSALLALATVEAFLNFGDSFFFGLVDYSVLQSAEWIIGVIAFIGLLSLIGGVYPALYLSSGTLVSLTKKASHTGSFSVANAQGFRKGATILQFICSIGLIFSIVVIFSQIDFLKKRDLGYSDEGVITIRNLSLFQNLRDNTSGLDTFINEMERLSSVKSYGFSTRTPIDDVQYFPIPMMNDKGEEIKVTYMNADPNFFELMNMEFVAGQSFQQRSLSSKVKEANSTYLPVVVNERTTKVLGLGNSIGKIIYEPIGKNSYEVVGVVKDFFFGSLREAVAPIIVRQTVPNVRGELLIKTDNVNETVAALEPIFQKHIWTAYGSRAMVWSDLEARYDSLLKEETNGYKLLVVFSIVAVIISCIGLLGLSLFMIDQRLHEFGVRKVLGATVVNIMRLFSYDVFKLISIALIIALPAGSLIMRQWLNDFVYQIDISVFIFGVTILLSLVIVFITIFFHSFKAGQLNPTETLRSE